MNENIVIAYTIKMAYFAIVLYIIYFLNVINFLGFFCGLRNRVA